jgi:uncharacterized damage-inducible protein DinB
VDSEIHRRQNGELIMSDDIRRLTGALRRILEGEAWHGPSVQEALAGLTADDAAARPIAGAHTIYELTHHLAAWTGEVERRLQGSAPGYPPEGDFPEPGLAIDEAAWAKALEELKARHASLIEATSQLTPERLNDRVGSLSPAFTGTGVSIYAMLHGLVQHDAYHAGQIVMLRRALGK